MHVQDELIPTRQSLLERLRDSADDESWRAFFETYWRLIYFTGIKAGLTEVEAQDLVQDTIISVFKSMEDFHYARQNGSFKNWLLGLTRWRIIDQFRKRQKNLTTLPESCGSDSHAGVTAPIGQEVTFDLEATWDKEWTENLMQAAVERVKRKVNPKHWQIFDLYTFQEWPLRRITAALGVSSAKVYIVNHRLKQALKKEFHALEKKPAT